MSTQSYGVDGIGDGTFREDSEVPDHTLPADHEIARLRDRRLGLIVLALLAAQLLLYHNAFGVRPSADDYILAGQIRVGEERGPWTFFTSSPLTTYRPLESLVYWAVGRWNPDNPFPLIHVLNFVAFGFYASVFVLWLRVLRLPLFGMACALALLFLHPVLAGPLADLDGFTRFVVSGWVWLGTYSAFRYANNLKCAIPLVAVSFIVGLGFMEYAVALVPLATVAMWWRRDSDRHRAALTLLLVLLAIFAVYYVVRISVIGSGSDSGRLSVDPLQFATNVALLGTAVLFMGNTVSAYVQQGVGTIAAAAGSAVLLMVLVLFGTWSWHVNGRTRRRLGADDSSSRGVSLLPSFCLLSFFPMVFMVHVSEIYTTAIVFAFSLQAGAAMTAWSWARPWHFRGAIAVFIILLLWGCVSVGDKVAALRDTGERAHLQTLSLLDSIPSYTHDVRVGLIFIESELPPRRTYSVFRGGDDHLIQPGDSARWAMEWFRPGQNIELVHVIVPDDSRIQSDRFAILLKWDPQTKRFHTWSS